MLQFNFYFPADQEYFRGSFRVKWSNMHEFFECDMLIMFYNGIDICGSLCSNLMS